ncbi:syntaxin-binding protein 5 isoform X2 [Diprion similis]|uniref:syntaxin-binding protein 5 isoform X2 n=1 Tax=Diprion similis TaxID=362088 RepID=UPI001EF93EA1|nr:syntaxin-binding protein 5 isoform X2 [Diprion similis]
MKKFTFKGVLDGFRSTVSQQVKPEQEIIETLRPDHFNVKKTFRHGFPFQPTAIAFDPIQRLLAIGTKTGSLRILGRPGVDVHVKHDGDSAVLQMQFLINEGALVSATADDTLHLWNFRQKIPQVVQSLKFQRERITFIHLPLQSKWLYVGTERGNIHVLHIETFVLSGYVINWNKAIEVSRKTHPGAVIHLSDNPLDLSKMLIGYESGQIVLWDLRLKSPDYRCQTTEPLKSISWHHDGKQFMCSHTDGSLSTWALRQLKPINVTHPHAKTTKDGLPEACKPIQKVEWKISRSGEAYVIFSGGLAYDTTGRTPSITVIQGKTTTVLEMEHNVVDFVTLCESPWTSDFQDPYAVVVLLHNDLVVIDLHSAGFPCFENPYPMDIHESPVTCCAYFADCPSDLIPAFYSVGSKTQKRTGFSESDWPISGGEWSPTSSSYNEIVLTGHADGSIKFWDASAGTLQVLYKLKTGKVFEKAKARSSDSDEDPLAVQLIFLCPESRKLAIVGSSRYVILFQFKKTEDQSEIVTLEIPSAHDVPAETECSPDYEYPPRGSLATEGGEEPQNPSFEYSFPLKVKTGPQRRAPGFQPTMVCLSPWINGEQPGNINALSLNSSYGLMAYGTETGLVIVDIIQKALLLIVTTQDLYASMDSSQRSLRSPKRYDERRDNEDKARSPSVDQIHYVQSDPVVGSESVVASADASSNISAVGKSCSSSSSSRGTGVDSVSDNDAEDQSGSDQGAASGDAQGVSGRKKNSWKGFNLKRQLSKVDLKLKTTFTGASQCSASSQAPQPHTIYQKRPSVGVCQAGSEAGGTASPPTEVETVSVFASCPPRHEVFEEIPESGEPAEGAGNEGESAACATSPADGNSAGREGNLAVSTAQEALERPDELPLFDNEGKPIRPRRDLSKKSWPHRRENRLLSVPHSKYQRNDGTHSDMKSREDGGPSFAGNLMRRFNKLDSSFTQSRSSSMSSLENITETINCLVFADSYTKKNEANAFPTLWIGTSQGSVLTVVFSAPSCGEQRHAQPIHVVTYSGSMFKLKGSMLTISFLDCNGALIPYSYESWREEHSDSKDRNKTPTKSTSTGISPTLNVQVSGEGFGDRQFVVLTSEKQARVVALPSQTCMYKQQLADTDFVIKAEITSLKDSVCLVCYVSSGHIATYSLPSLRLLIDVDFLPLVDLSFQTTKRGIEDPMLSIWGQQLFVNEDTDLIARTFCFSNKGHGLYLTSPTEIQKFTVCNEFWADLTEMMGEIFICQEMPEPPKESFLRGLFGGGSRSLDREELFGESSGRASRTVAKHIPGPCTNNNGLREKANSAMGDVSHAHQMVVERGDKLSQLEDRTARMMSEAETFSQSAHGIMLKYKDKKWYQL